jgi:hypothetical protein
VGTLYYNSIFLLYARVIIYVVMGMTQIYLWSG